MIEHIPPGDDPGVPCTRCLGTGVEPADAPDGAPGPAVSHSDAPEGGNGPAGIKGDGKDPDAGAAHGKLGKPMCGRRRKRCRKCRRKFSKEEHEIWDCPNCGESRACRNAPTVGTPLGSPCKFHGGMSLPAGPLHPTWKHGRYSKITPPHMTEAYETAMKDEQLLSIREEIALYNAMIVERWGRLGKLEAASKLWADLKVIWGNLEKARAAGDTDAMLTLLNQVGKRIRDGSEVGQLFSEVDKLCLSKGKLTKWEFQRLRDMRQLVTQERVTALVVSLCSSVRDNVSSSDELRQIAYDFSLLLDDRTVDAKLVDEPDSDG